MKKVGLFILLLITSSICSAQKILSKGLATDTLYALVFDDLNKQTQSANAFPQIFVVKGNTLDYVAEFLSTQSTAAIKDFIDTENWNFIPKIDTAKSFLGERRKSMESLRPLFKSSIKIKRNLNYTYSFSPIIFANDHRKAFLISQKTIGIEIIDITCYFFEQTSGGWVLIKTQDPYLI